MDNSGRLCCESEGPEKTTEDHQVLRSRKKKADLEVWEKRA